LAFLAINWKLVIVNRRDFEGGKRTPDVFIINDKGQLAKTVNKQVRLNKETISTLSKRLGQRELGVFGFRLHIATTLDPS
jgi:hypothetical protein